MVAQMMGDVLGVIGLVLAHAEHLRGAGLARRGVRRALEGFRRRAAGLVHRHHASMHHLPVRRIEVDALGHWRDHRREAARAHVFDRTHHARLVARALIGQRGQRRGHLQRGEAVVALADTQTDGVAGIPALLRRAAKGLALPLARRQHALGLALEIDAGSLTEAELLRPLGHAVHAPIMRDHVEIHVARHLYGLVHVDDAMPAWHVIAKTVSGEHEKTGVVKAPLRGADAVGQRARRQIRFVSRARRKGAAQHAVEQRPVGRGVERVPVDLIDAVDEQIGIEGGHGDEAQHFTVARIDGHASPAPLAIEVFDELLQADIDSEHQILSGRGRHGLDLAHRPPHGIDLDFLIAGDAVQLRLVSLLHAQLADMVGAEVVAGVVTVVDALLLGLVDAADIAQQMATQRAQRIVAKQPCPHIHARKTKALRHEASHLIIAELVENRQRLKAPRLPQQIVEAPLVERRDGHDGLERIDGVLQCALDLRRRDFQRVSRVVVGQDDAVAVENQPALRRNRHQRNAVVLRLGRKLPMPHHLQPHPATDQQRKAQHHHGRGQNQTAAKAEQLAFDVAQLGHRKEA